MALPSIRSSQKIARSMKVPITKEGKLANNMICELCLGEVFHRLYVFILNPPPPTERQVS